MTVSVIIPSFNREKTILASVNSALEQSHRDLEVIVVDDGSTDRTVEVLESVADRIRIVCQQNAGPSAARNRGVKESSGEIIAFLDSDDYWAPEKIERQIGLMKRGGPEMICCVCNATVKGVAGITLASTFASAGLAIDFPEGVWTNPQEVLSTRFLLFNQVVAIRRNAFERVGGFNEGLRLLEDYELSLRLGAMGVWGVIRDPLVIKDNDTNGVGVICMTDREMHAKVRAGVIAGLLGSEADLMPSARRNLERGLVDMKAESQALALMKNGTVGGAAGRIMMFAQRIRMAARRRSRGWPRFQGAEL